MYADWHGKEWLKMKKILSAVLAAAMLMPTAVQVMAKDTDEMQNVLAQIKDRIPDTSAFENFTSESYNSNNKENYVFNWNSNTKDEYKSMHVGVSGSGIINQYHYYDETVYGRRDDTPSVNRLSQDEALAKTKELVKKLNPDIYSALKIEKVRMYDSLFDSTYHFSIQRRENDIPVYQDTGYVVVNSDVSKIIDYSMQYTEGLTFADPSDIMDKNGAWEAFAKNAGMELQYRSEYKDDKETVVAVYVPIIDSGEYINAESGKIEDIVHISYDTGYGISGGANAATEDAASYGSMKADREMLTERELEEMDKVAGLISDTEAENIVRNMSELDFDSKMQKTGINLFKSWNNDDYYYRIIFASEADEDKEFARATVNAKTGELISWYRDGKNSEEKLDKEEHIKLAEEVISKIAPAHFGDKKDYRLNDDAENDYSVSYIRYVNGVKFNNDTVNIKINPTNKKVMSYSLVYTDIEFPSLDNVISAEEAAKKLSEQASLTMYYIPSSSNGKVYDGTVIGYMLDNLYNCELDANTGKINNTNISPDEALVYTDINGHYAEKAIKTLAQFGIGFEAGEYKPDELITQQEYAALLMSIFEYNSPILLRDSEAVNSYYVRAVNDDIIREEDGNPKDALTREKAAVYMIRAMGAEEYAQLSGIYRQIFPDVTENIGYIDILAGMKVFNGDENGNFNPHKNLTRADAAMIIYNFLTK